MRIHWTGALLAAAALAAPMTALAQLAAERERIFREKDKNHDGVLTLEEYGGHPGNFRAMDTNGDGVLSLDEFVNRYREGDQNAPPSAAAPAVTTEVPLQGSNPLPLSTAEVRFRALDRNGKGFITRNEWRGEALPFDVVDRNRDNRITLDEYLNQPVSGVGYGTGTSALERRFAQLDRNGKGFITRNEWRGEVLPFDVVDRNRDNRITLDEYLNQPVSGVGYGTGTSALERRFAQVDRNHDGVITRNEWRGEPLSFDVVDRNHDNRITLDEYLNQPAGGNGYGNRNGSRATLEQRFAQMDRNGDGVLTPSEWRDPRPFRQVDLNGDGVVTLDEYLNAPVVYEQPSPYDPYSSRSPSSSARFEDLDRNGNGYIERQEWPYDLAEFDRLDRDHDGRLTRHEYESAEGRTGNTYEQFRRLDRNGDGVISRREWNGTAQSFDDYDLNGDGVISLDEFLNHDNYNR